MYIWLSLGLTFAACSPGAAERVDNGDRIVGDDQMAATARGILDVLFRDDEREYEGIPVGLVRNVQIHGRHIERDDPQTYVLLALWATGYGAEYPSLLRATRSQFVTLLIRQMHSSKAFVSRFGSEGDPVQWAMKVVAEDFAGTDAERIAEVTAWLATYESEFPDIAEPMVDLVIVLVVEPLLEAHVTP